MYAYIKGKIAQKNENSIVIDNNGIGYLLYVSCTTLEKCKSVDFDITLFTYLQVKEDGMTLFGFGTTEEKEFFLKLISINGIGPKMAMQILSGMSLNDLATSIATGDVKSLTKVKGLGKKTAERIILELKGQFKADCTYDSLFDIIEKEETNDIQDVVFALTSLGVAKTEAMALAKQASKEVQGIENIIAYCLKRL